MKGKRALFPVVLRIVFISDRDVTHSPICNNKASSIKKELTRNQINSLYFHCSCVGESEFAEDFAITARAQGAPDLQGDIFADRADRAIYQNRVDDAYMITSRSDDRVRG